MATISDVLAALAAAGIVLDAPESAPVAAPVAASPFAVLTTAVERTRDLPASVAAAMNAAADGTRQKIGRIAAAYYAEARFSCDANTRTLTGPDGPRDAGHGFITPHDSGTACPTAGCEGKIR